MSIRLGLFALVFALAPAIARADILYEYRYTGEVTSVSDAYGLFGDVPVGTQVSGVLRIFGPAPQGIDVAGFAERYDFPTGGGNVFTTVVGSRTFEASESLGVTLTNPAKYANPGVFVNGRDDVAKLDASNVPDGEYIASLINHLGFQFPQGTPGPYPDLPPALLPLSQYGAFPLVSGLVQAYTNDDDDDVAETSAINFQITSFRAVPEPASLAMLGIGGLVLGCLRRRK